MATFDLETSFKTLRDTAILPQYDGHPVVQAKMVEFSAFKPFEAGQVFESLNSYFNSSDMLVIAHSNSPQPIPMHQMTLEALNEAMLTRLRSESQALLGDEYVNTYNDLKAMVEASNDSSAQAMLELQQLCFRSVLEAISCASVKKGALFSNPFTQTPILLLGSRGLYVTDKARVGAALAREKKAVKFVGKASTAGKPNKDNAPVINPQGKPRRTISDNEEEADQLSEATIDDVSCHEGDGDSPYDSEGMRSPGSSTQATPVMQPQLQPSEDPVQLTLTPVNQDIPRPPMNIQLPTNPLVPLMTIPLGALGTPNPLGGTLGSVPVIPVAAAAMKHSSKKRAKKQGKAKKSKKAKKSRSRSSSSSSASSIEVPPPKPSVDQVFLLSLLPT